ncbi:hypothetical protein [Methylobacterium nigriterrae]|uniref:hypothetical protein n=1 Tax=Methylobacterium nigriterrae TaxID=3127512 RepID=UPI003013E7F0
MTASTQNKLNALAISIAEAECRRRDQAEFIARRGAEGEDVTSSMLLLHLLEENLKVLRERQHHLQAGGAEH